MQFFDLNIPFLQGDKSVPEKSTKKQSRLKLIVKAMELGYSGIACNRTIKGLMSESDRCTIPPFPLSSLLNVSPSLSSTVTFHRHLLGVSNAVPFRQYTRLTVLVETSSQASTLNSGNSVLKTYDLVAVRPLNQNSFDHACQSSQVDLISIDFSGKLPFRLKLPMVKAAIARGVYFEIMYSSIMEDAQLRRQTISNAKLLVEWTRGKNLIVSSAAPSVLELRGPNDVANLLFLLGLSEEHAKAAISKNCRLLITSALRKKHFYKEAIRVEVMPAGSQADPKDPWIVDCLDWDPISSGEGDLLLDDMAKSFAQSGKISQTVKAIDFASIGSSTPAQGLQVKDIDLRVEDKSHSSDNVMELMSAFKDLEATTELEKLQKESTFFHSCQLDQQGTAGEKSKAGMSSDLPNAFSVGEGPGVTSSLLSELRKSNVLGVDISPGGSRESDQPDQIVCHSEDMLVCSNSGETPRIAELGSASDSKVAITIRSKDLSYLHEEGCSKQQVSGVLNRTGAVASTERQLVGQSPSSDIALSGCVSQLKEDHLFDTNSTMNADRIMDVNSFPERTDRGGLLLGDFPLQEKLAEEEEQREDCSNVKVDAKELSLAHTTMQGDSFSESNDGGDDLLVAKSMLLEDMMVEARKIINEFPKTKYRTTSENKSGKRKVKGSSSGHVLRFPFKRLLQVQYKKKGRMPVYKS